MCYTGFYTVFHILTYIFSVNIEILFFRFYFRIIVKESGVCFLLCFENYTNTATGKFVKTAKLTYCLC